MVVTWMETSVLVAYKCFILCITVQWREKKRRYFSCLNIEYDFYYGKSVSCLSFSHWWMDLFVHWPNFNASWHIVESTMLISVKLRNHTLNESKKKRSNFQIEADKSMVGIVIIRFYQSFRHHQMWWGFTKQFHHPTGFPHICTNIKIK